MSHHSVDRGSWTVLQIEKRIIRSQRNKVTAKEWKEIKMQLLHFPYSCELCYLVPEPLTWLLDFLQRQLVCGCLPAGRRGWASCSAVLLMWLLKIDSFCDSWEMCFGHRNDQMYFSYIHLVFFLGSWLTVLKMSCDMWMRWLLRMGTGGWIKHAYVIKASINPQKDSCLRASRLVNTWRGDGWWCSW